MEYFLLYKQTRVSQSPAIAATVDSELASPEEAQGVKTQGLLLLFSRSVVSDSLQPRGLQHTRLPPPSPSPRVCSNSYPVGDAIQPSHPLSPPSPPTLSLSQHQGLFQ